MIGQLLPAHGVEEIGFGRDILSLDLLPIVQRTLASMGDERFLPTAQDLPHLAPETGVGSARLQHLNALRALVIDDASQSYKLQRMLPTLETCIARHKVDLAVAGLNCQYRSTLDRKKTAVASLPH